jgi:hypothetical protein
VFSTSLSTSRGIPPSFLTVLFIILVFIFLILVHFITSSSFVVRILIYNLVLLDAIVYFVILISLETCLSSILWWLNPYQTYLSRTPWCWNLVSTFHFTILAIDFNMLHFLCLYVLLILVIESLCLPRICPFLLSIRYIVLLILVSHPQLCAPRPWFYFIILVFTSPPRASLNSSVTLSPASASL